MQSNPAMKIFWVIVAVGAIYFIIHLMDQAVSVVPFPSMNAASSTASSVPKAPSSQPVSIGLSDSTASGDSAAVSPYTYSVILIHAPAGIVSAFVASTSDQQELGLGQRASLPADEGMLFPFAIPGQYGFWMKDMDFPLDMVWIAPDKAVIAISRDVQPDSYPSVIYPPGDISYVLELNADSASKYGIATSTKLVF